MLSHRGDWACFRLLTTVIIGVAAKAFRRRPSAAPSLVEMDWENLGYISSSSLCWQEYPSLRLPLYRKLNILTTQ